MAARRSPFSANVNASSATPTISNDSFESVIVRPTGFSRPNDRAKRRLTITTFGAPASSRSEKSRPISAIRIVRKNPGPTEAMTALPVPSASVVRAPGMLTGTMVPPPIGRGAVDRLTSVTPGSRLNSSRTPSIQPWERLALITDVTRPDREQQQVLPIETWLDAAQRGERAPEQRRADQQHERQRDLHDDQRTAEASSEAPARSVVRADLFERRCDVDPGRLQRRHQA